MIGRWTTMGRVFRIQFQKEWRTRNQPEFNPAHKNPLGSRERGVFYPMPFRINHPLANNQQDYVGYSRSD